MIDFEECLSGGGPGGGIVAETASRIKSTRDTNIISNETKLGPPLCLLTLYCTTFFISLLYRSV